MTKKEIIEQIDQEIEWSRQIKENGWDAKYGEYTEYAYEGRIDALQWVRNLLVDEDKQDVKFRKSHRL